MPILRIDLDAHSFERLAESAFRELRPVNWQAEVLLRRALGLLAPTPLVLNAQEPQHASEPMTHEARSDE